MRRRLLTSTLAVAGVALVLLGLPLAIAVRNLLVQQALTGLQQEVERVQVLLNSGSLTFQDAQEGLDQLATESGTRFVLFASAGPFGTVRIDTGEPPPVPFSVARALAVPGGEVARVADRDVIAVSVPLRVGGVRQTLVGVRDDEALTGQVRGAWFAIAGLAVTALGAAALVAVWQGRRLAVPVEALAASARRLGDGDFTARAPRSGLPEVDDVATALDTTATRLAGMLERSRSFGADASHQLRTPLTALRLDLEALEVTGADPALMAATYAEADRLETTITELLALAAAPAGEEVVDVARLVADRIGAWESLAASQGRRVVLDADPAPAVRVRAAALGQCLQVLLDNALAHGDGTITVSVRQLGGAPEGGRGERWVRVCVGDEGPGVPADLAGTVLLGPPPGADARHADAADPDAGDVDAGQEAPGVAAGGHATRSGRGLPLARSLIEAEGGRLHLQRSAPGAVFCVVLPAVPGTVPAAPPP